MSRTIRPASASVAVRRDAAALTHPDRVLFADVGLTKADLQRYYARVREVLWPQLEGRPLSVLRAAGPGKTFFQRHAAEQYPALFLPVPGIQGEARPWMRLREVEAIEGLAQPGIVELHAWSTRLPRLGDADRLVFDLDPDPALDWPRVRDAALRVRGLLDSLGLDTRLKTSGGAGLHVVAPLAPVATQAVVAAVAEAIARHLACVAPREFTATRGAPHRHGRVFIDWLRNGYAASTVAAWSPRLRPGAPVSMPLDWDELGAQDLRHAHFNLRNAPQRLAERGDPWLRRTIGRQTLTASIRSRIAALSQGKPTTRGGGPRVRPGRSAPRPGGSAPTRSP